VQLLVAEKSGLWNKDAKAVITVYMELVAAGEERPVQDCWYSYVEHETQEEVCHPCSKWSEPIHQGALHVLDLHGKINVIKMIHEMVALLKTKTAAVKGKVTNHIEDMVALLQAELVRGERR